MGLLTYVGNANRDMELAVSVDKEESSTGELAEQAFVFLARAVFKPSLSVPVAHYFSANLTGTACRFAVVVYF